MFQKPRAEARPCFGCSDVFCHAGRRNSPAHTGPWLCLHDVFCMKTQPERGFPPRTCPWSQPSCHRNREKQTPAVQAPASTVFWGCSLSAGATRTRHLQRVFPGH